MNITKKELGKSVVELVVELSLEEFQPYIKKGTKKLSEEIKIEGFRPGNAPYDLVKQKVGEMTILEEASRLAINGTIWEAIDKNLGASPIGQPQIDILKLAPGNPISYKITISILPEVTLGDYKNAKVKEDAAEVKDDEVEKMISNLRESRVKEALADREVKEGDKVLVDIEMFLDKVPVEGGQGKSVAVIIGKDYFVPGFDKKLLGAKKGEKVEFSLPYPKEHYQANLAGKMVEFIVKINEVYARELPELNDDFAKGFGAKTMADLKIEIRKTIEHEKKHQVEEKAEIKMLGIILEKTKFGDIPELLVQSETEGMIEDLKHSVESQGGKFEDYLTSIKKTHDQLTLDILPDAIKRVKSALMIREIANAEKIEVSEKELDEKIEEILKQYQGYEKVAERVKEPDYRHHMKNILTNRKVVEKLREWNVMK